MTRMCLKSPYLQGMGARWTRMGVRGGYKDTGNRRIEQRKRKVLIPPPPHPPLPLPLHPCTIHRKNPDRAKPSNRLFSFLTRVLGYFAWKFWIGCVQLLINLRHKIKCLVIQGYESGSKRPWHHIPTGLRPLLCCLFHSKEGKLFM